MLSNIEGTAITGIKIPGIVHEFSTITNVREDYLKSLNIKQIVLSGKKEMPSFGYVSVQGPGVITANSIKLMMTTLKL